MKITCKKAIIHEIHGIFKKSEILEIISKILENDNIASIQIEPTVIKWQAIEVEEFKVDSK